MTLILQLPADVERRLNEAAERDGIALAEYVNILLCRSVSESNSAGTMKDLFAEWSARDHTDDPAEIARREAEFEEFKANMNRNRLESEGPNARKIYP